MNWISLLLFPEMLACDFDKFPHQSILKHGLFELAELDVQLSQSNRYMIHSLEES